MQQVIPWTQVTADTFMYGTCLEITEQATYFENALMPSGCVIHEWKMMTVYSTDKTFPQLPILKHGRTYRFTFDFDVEPAGGVYFKINFKKRNGVELEHVIVQSHEADVTFPDDAFSYDIQMINAAATSVCFRAIVIAEQQEMKETRALTISSILNEQSETSTMNIICVGEQGLSRDAQQGLHNIILIEHAHQDDIQRIVTCLEPLTRGYVLNVIGYTSYTNQLAYQLASTLDATAWVTSKSDLQDNSAATIHEYGTMSHSPHQLVAPLFHESRPLRDLDRMSLNGGMQE